MRIFLTTVICLLSLNILAQSPQDSTEQAESPSNWESSWVINLSGNQASYRDWSQGGVNSVASTASTLFKLKYSGEHFFNTSRVNLRFGQTQQDGEDIQKTEDMIRVSNKTDYFLSDEKHSAFAEVAFRTQFAKGYDPVSGEKRSGFMSPGYFIESIGYSYQPSDVFNAQLGMGLKQTFVWQDGLDQFYGLGEDEDIRSEGGLTIAFMIEKELVKNFTYSAEFNSFSNLLIPIRSTDFNMRNVFTGKINNFLSTTFEFSFLYDDDFTTKLQMMQVLALGVNITIL